MRSRGDTLITAPCGHAFHFSCLQTCVRKGGIKTCPLCRASIQDFVNALCTQQSVPSNCYNQSTFPAFSHRHPQPSPTPFLMHNLPGSTAPPRQFRQTMVPIPDDEIPSVAPATTLPSSAAVHHHHEVQMEVCAEQDCAPISSSKDLTLMITLRGCQAPTTTSRSTPRSPMDVVMVLDRSGSMSGHRKMDLLRDSVRYVVQQLTKEDRLSVITFNSSAELVGGMKVMTPAGQDYYLHALDRINGPFTADGGTDIRQGIQLAQRVLEQRRHHHNPVTAVMLLTDGQDNNNWRGSSYDWHSFPACSFDLFGFGSDHDSALLKSIAEYTNGRFTYVENPDALGLSFGSTLGGLRSTVAREIKLSAIALDPHRILRALSPGATLSPVNDLCTWTLPSLMHDEQKDFLLTLRVPPSSSSPPSLSVCVEYRTAESLSAKQSQLGFAVPHRDPRIHPPVPNSQVGVQILRLQVAEILNNVGRLLVSRHERASAATELQKARQLLSSASSLADHPLVKQLVLDIDECEYRLRNDQSEASVQACVNTFQQQHQQQTAVTNQYSCPSNRGQTRGNAYCVPAQAAGQATYSSWNSSSQP